MAKSADGAHVNCHIFYIATELTESKYVSAKSVKTKYIHVFLLRIDMVAETNLANVNGLWDIDDIKVVATTSKYIIMNYISNLKYGFPLTGSYDHAVPHHMSFALMFKPGDRQYIHGINVNRFTWLVPLFIDSDT